MFCLGEKGRCNIHVQVGNRKTLSDVLSTAGNSRLESFTPHLEKMVWLHSVQIKLKSLLV